MPTRLVVAVVAVAALLLPAVAGAAPVTIGPGTLPDVQMDSAGNVVVAYRSTTRNVAAVCVLPPRGTACAPAGAVPAFGTDSFAEIRALQLLRRPADGALVLLVSLFDSNDPASDVDGHTVWQSTSPDGGATWAAPIKIGTGQGFIEDASLTPDGLAVNAIGGEPGAAQFSRLPLSGPPVPPAIDLKPGDDVVSQQSITTQADGTVIAGFKSKRWGLARLPAGADPATGWRPWKRAGKVRADETDQELVTGPRGTYSIAQRYIVTQIKKGYQPLLLRRVTATGVSKGTRVGSGFTNVASGLAIDALGGLHAAFFNTQGRNVEYLRTRGPRGRCSFGRQTRQVRLSLPQQPVELEMAAATPKLAVAVYEQEDREVIQALSLRGGDTPKPRKSAKC